MILYQTQAPESLFLMVNIIGVWTLILTIEYINITILELLGILNIMFSTFVV